jgi:hypothetical protein
VGYNPYRKKVVRTGDVVVLGAAIAAVLAVVAWAIFG